MTTSPSAAPWADQPYKLLPHPRLTDTSASYAFHIAYEMSKVHNVLTRGLNAIVLQAPHIPESTKEGYSAQDVKDLLFYVEQWAATVNHHHNTEETIMFPAFEELAGQPGLMSGPLHQHEAFHNGLVELLNYAKKFGERPDEYQWEAMKSIIEGFAPPLMQHLGDEIGILKDLEKTCDSDGLKSIWANVEATAKASGNLTMFYNMFPLVLGCIDKTSDGGNDGLGFPAPFPYAIKFWFGRRYAGAWRFNPCTYWGKPQPLAMLPENRRK
ncbi:hypothetical protein BJ878DRAFT_513057 [Calycina marina]|uniref:Hemerythrin-like domain-containing protein n=1 Tax=Calycina marina TaxID=1763456 RepID=A0A9P7YZP9_9HELO|nr:hypothetical protein BJ878DRAFT_513057 [Calycina marina]